MPEFVFHWVVLGEVYYDLGLERPHRYGAQQQPFPDGEYGCLFHARSLERPFSDGVHEDVCRGMDEDTQAVGLEGVAGEAVAFHALLELPYEQLVAPAAAYEIFKLRPRLLWRLLTSAGSLLLLTKRLAPQTSSDKGIVFPPYTCHIYTHRSE